MSDPRNDTDPAVEDDAALDEAGLPTPRPHQKDKGHVVAGAGHEPIPGLIADITDGDT